MVDHSRSVLASALLVVAAVIGGVLFKDYLSNSRPGTLIGGGSIVVYFIQINNILGIGSAVFIFTLTALSNIKMSNSGEQATSGLAEVLGALLFGVIVAASIHRICATICILFSLGSLFFLTSIAQQRYAPVSASAQQAASIKKRK